MTDYNFVYPYTLNKQLTLDQKEIEVRVPADFFHLVEEGCNTALCGADLEEIGKDMGGIEKKKARPHGLSICPKCSAKWKKLPDSEWYRWEQAVFETGKEK